MRIAILARNPKLYSHRRLVEAGRKRGHQVRIINPLYCYMNILSSRPEVRYRGGEVVHHVDAIIPRIGASVTFYATAVLRQFEAMGVYPLNSSSGILKARDKLHSLQLLAQEGIPMPVTGFAHSPLDTEDLISLVGGAPVVIKLLEGTQGCGVMLADTKTSAASVINAFKRLSANILVQAYIKEANGTDIRCFVIGREVVATMLRQAKPGEFRANIHLGGTANAVDITAEERAIAIKATEAVGLQVAGVDIIRSKHGPLVLEINPTPGLEGIEKTSQLDIAERIILHIEHEMQRAAQHPK